MKLKFLDHAPSDFKYTQKNDPKSYKTVNDNNQLLLLIFVHTDKY